MTGLLDFTSHATDAIVARDGARRVRRVACRARWTLAGHVAKPRAPSPSDRFSTQGELLVANDFGPKRLGTTVLVTGRIVSEPGEFARAVHARIEIAPLAESASQAQRPRRFEAVAYPPRVWVKTDAGFVAQAIGPFEPVAATFAEAFGGPSCDANPIGKGALEPGASAEGQPLPRVEAPESPLDEPFGRPPPRALGLVAPGWTPRKEFAGTYDERWRRTRAPELPEDASPRLFDPGSFVLEPKLRGGERIDLVNFAEPGPRSIVVPRVLVRFVVDRRTVRPEIDEVHVDLDAGTIELLLRADLPWDGSIPLAPIFVRELGLVERAS